MFRFFRPRKTNRHSARHLFFRPAVQRLEARVQPSTYFVATNGQDSNPGTIDLPFATLTHAAALSHAGDTVDVRGGTYSLQTTQSIGTSGTAAAPIVFQSYPGETAVIDGSQLPKNTSTDAIAIGGHYLIFQNFEVRNSPHNGIAVWGGSHVQLLSNVVHDNQYSGIYSGYSSLGVVSDIRVDGNTIYHNSLMNSAKTLSNWPAALVGQRVSGYTITNNTVYDNYGEGIDFCLTDQGLAAGNTVHDNYSAEMYLDNTTHVTLQQNLVYTTHDPTYYRTWGVGTAPAPAASFQVANETYNDSNPCNYDTIINNIATGGHWNFYYGNYKNGGGLKNFLIANNTFYASTYGSMIRIDPDAGHVNTVIANNIFDQTGGTQMTDYHGSAGISFSYNLWFGGSAGLAAGTGDVKANPQLVNPGTTSAADYKLTGGSPAIDRGTTLAAVTTDYFGTPRPQGGAYDIGADEYVPAPTQGMSNSPPAPVAATATVVAGSTLDAGPASVTSPAVAAPAASAPLMLTADAVDHVFHSPSAEDAGPWAPSWNDGPGGAALGFAGSQSLSA